MELQHQLYRKLVALSDRFGEISSYDYYGSGSQVAIDSFRDCVRYFVSHYQELSLPSIETLHELLLNEFVPMLRYIQRSATSNVPWSIIPYLESTIRSELGEDYLIVFRPQWNYNFTVITTDWVRYFRDILAVFFPDNDVEFSSKTLHVFSFPYLEKTNVLLHSAMGHEIGHFFTNQYMSGDSWKATFAHHVESLTKFYEDQETEKGGQPDMVRPILKTDTGKLVVQGFMQEILSDFFGYLLIGPSVLFALYHISFLQSKPHVPSEENAYYPPIKFRIRCLLDFVVSTDDTIKNLIANREIGKDVEQILNAVEDYTKSMDDRAPIAEYEQEIRIVEGELPDVIQKAREMVKHRYQLSTRLPNMVSRLSSDLPINEIDGHPSSMAEILLAGWIIYFRLASMPVGEAYVRAYQTLVRLLLKSLFASAIQVGYGQSVAELDARSKAPS